MSKKSSITTVILLPEDNSRLANLCGPLHQNIKQMENFFDVLIHNRGNIFEIAGKAEARKKAAQVLKKIYLATKTHRFITSQEIHLMLKDTDSSKPKSRQNKIRSPHYDRASASDGAIKTPKLTVKPRGHNQRNYVQNMLQHDINFSVGPAGTGKTYLAVACAVQALQKEEVERIILVRPVVEAGEHLGFLPGDIAQKIDPYLRPLYDALYEMYGAKEVEELLAEHVIEIAPLAFMRGRTLNAAFVILDESQNTTIEQMQMFLTRIGFGSKAVITGDITQIDLAKSRQSGLVHALKVLQKVNGISFNTFSPHDVVRHPLVQRIVEAYARDKETDV